MIKRRTFSGHEIRYSAAAAAADDNNDDRGGIAPLTPSCDDDDDDDDDDEDNHLARNDRIDGGGGPCAQPRPSRIRRCRLHQASCAVRKYADARAFECHQCADDVRAFVLGQGRRDDGANSIVIGDSGDDVHRGGRGTDDGDGDGNGDSDGDDILS
jgi:hypothetical protein